VLLAKGAVQDRHEELDVELLDACTAHDAERAAKALHDHLDLAADIYAVELKGRSIFAF
jgi:DNA-binding GntR family transcriptional regulator